MRLVLVLLGSVLAASAAGAAESYLQTVKRHYDHGSRLNLAAAHGLLAGRCYPWNEPNSALASVLVFETSQDPWRQGPIFEPQPRTMTKMAVWGITNTGHSPDVFDDGMPRWMQESFRAEVDSYYRTGTWELIQGENELMSTDGTGAWLKVRGDAKYYYAWITAPDTDFHTKYCYFFKRIKE